MNDDAQWLPLTDGAFQVGLSYGQMLRRALKHEVAALRQGRTWWVRADDIERLRVERLAALANR
jgi:hypothetical protein